MIDTLVVANPHVHVLAESPIWDSARERLLWVDIPRGQVLAGVLDGGGAIEIVERVDVGSTVGAVAPAADGGWLVAGSEALLVRRPGEAPRPWLALIESGGTRRLNDGKPDPAGRYVVGTLSLDGPSVTEQLFTVEPSGRVRQVDDDLTLSNGLAWNADGDRFFSVDSNTRSVYVRPYDARSGEWGERKLFVRPDCDGVPDGMCIDADDHLWIAFWGAGEVRRYTRDGTLDEVLEVPAPHVSSVAFAGPALDTLVITTSTEGLSPDDLARWPDSGRLLTARPGVGGLPQAPWSGPTTIC